VFSRRGGERSGATLPEQRSLPVGLGAWRGFDVDQKERVVWWNIDAVFFNWVLREFCYYYFFPSFFISLFLYLLFHRMYVRARAHSLTPPLCLGVRRDGWASRPPQVLSVLIGPLGWQAPPTPTLTFWPIDSSVCLSIGQKVTNMLAETMKQIVREIDLNKLQNNCI